MEVRNAILKATQIKMYLLFYILEPTAKRRRREDSTQVYAAELLLFDKNNHCNLVAGDYELSLKMLETAVKTLNGKINTWDKAVEVPIEMNKVSLE
jgi:hypothetical protein